MRMLTAVVLFVFLFSAFALMQENSAREVELEKENAALKAQLAAKPLSEAEQRAKTLAVFSKIYADSPRLAEAEACKAAKGKFSILVLDGKVGTLCELKVK